MKCKYRIKEIINYGYFPTKNSEKFNSAPLYLLKSLVTVTKILIDVFGTKMYKNPIFDCKLHNI